MLVLGAGGIGIAVIQGARLAGASVIVVVDPVAERREAALRFGATHTIDPTDDRRHRLLHGPHRASAWTTASRRPARPP